MRQSMLVRAGGGAALAAALVVGSAGAVRAEHPPDPVAGAVALHLVTLDGPGLAGQPGRSDPSRLRADLVAAQDEALAAVDAPEPQVRWTTALNGFAVELDAEQAAALADQPGVALVEPDAVRRVAGQPSAATAPVLPAPGRGGRGVVVGIVDTGIDPSSPVFAASGALGARVGAFAEACPAAEGWSPEDCTDKLVAARHFVAGFGEDRLASGSRLSPFDDDGHGTQVAALAVGNARVPARYHGQPLGWFSGTAPDARLAAYKACWTAPDPADDGCATSDVVSAIDQAVADRVDVLGVAVTGTPRLDTVDLALLGAAEADVVVVTPAGNSLAVAGHAQPWTTTVGSVSGPRRTGRLVVGGESLRGRMTSRAGVAPTQVVDAGTAPAPGATREEAARCLPGSLDAARTSGAIVVCDRGGSARIEKSAAVALADGAGMVLVSAPGQPVGADVHAVPTLQIGAATGARLRELLDRPGRLRARLQPLPTPPALPRLAPWSPSGPRSGPAVKPDVVAPGSALLTATSAADGRPWDLLSGSSGSTALVTGLAARTRSAHPDWSASRIRSALATTAGDVAGTGRSPAQGAGVAGPRAVAPGLVYDVGARLFRRVLEGALPAGRLNLPSLVVPRRRGDVVLTRTVTNPGTRHRYFSSSASGFADHRVEVAPAAIRIGPGETRTFRVTVAPGSRARADHGWVTWLGSDGTRVRIPVLVR